jgi:hypothetical protein
VGGSTTVEIGERISPNDMRFGIDFVERTKKISDYYKNHFREMRARLEHKNYFKKMILNSFAYKEIEVLSELKYNLDINLKKYHLLNKFIPENSNVFHVANDFGELDVLLTLQEPKRKITTFIIDKEKRDIAKTNYIIKKRKISYLNCFEEFEDKIKDVALISNNNFSFELLIKYEFNKVIFINSKIDNLQLLFEDYSIEFEDINTVVLNKKSI